MQVHWSYEGLSYRHTADEIDDPDCHAWQGPMGADELIIHAANLHLYRSGEPRTAADGSDLPSLWSLAGKSQRAVLFEEPKRVTQA